MTPGRESLIASVQICYSTCYFSYLNQPSQSFKVFYYIDRFGLNYNFFVQNEHKFTSIVTSSYASIQSRFINFSISADPPLLLSIFV